MMGGFSLFTREAAPPPPEQRYRPQPVRAGVPGLLSLAGSDGVVLNMARRNGVVSCLLSSGLWVYKLVMLADMSCRL